MNFFSFFTIFFIIAFRVTLGLEDKIIGSDRFNSVKEVQSYYEGNPNIGTTFFVVETCLLTSQPGVKSALKAIKGFFWLSNRIIIHVQFHKYQFALRSIILDMEGATQLIDSLIARDYETDRAITMPGQQNYENRWKEIITQNSLQTALGKDLVVHYLCDIPASRRKYSIRLSDNPELGDSVKAFRYLIEPTKFRDTTVPPTGAIVEGWAGTYYYDTFEDLHEHVHLIEQHYKETNGSKPVKKIK